MQKNTILFIAVFLLAVTNMVNAQNTKLGICTSGNCVNGAGVFTYTNKTVYTGNFVDGKRSGKGIGFIVI